MLFFKQLFDKKTVVLMYHRVAITEVDPWELAVHPVNFEAQLKRLKSFSLLSLDELTSQLSQNKLKHKAVAITFDDGYVDNFLYAKPLLEKHQVPATFFITSRNIGKDTEFWWDELAAIILRTKNLPETFQLEWNNIHVNFEIGKEAVLTNSMETLHKSFSIYSSFPTLRSQLYYTIWEQLHPLCAADQEVLMNQIRLWASVPESKRSDFTCMSAQQVAELAHKTLFSVGGHTNTHPALPYFEKYIQFKEISENKHFLEGVTGSPLRHFSFPSGKYNAHSIEAVQEAGFQSSVTTDHKPITKGTNPFLIGRFQVNNWDGDLFERKLKSWFKN